MDDDLQLSDLIQFYPSPYDYGFQQKIAEKREFNSLSSETREEAPKKGEFFKHQTFTHRFLTDNDDLLLCDEPGTGKTCSVIGFTEKCIREAELFKQDPLAADKRISHFERVIILVSGPTQVAEIRSQIACKCSNEKYINEDVIKAKDEKSQRKAVKRAISKWYSILSYNAFYKICKTLIAENIHKQELKNTIFWIDEAHNLNLEQVDKRDSTKKEIYDVIWKIFHEVPRCKRILTTATPMINIPNELKNLMNLLLPANNKMPENYNYQDAPQNDIITFFPNLPSNINHRTADYKTMNAYYMGQMPEHFNVETATLQQLEPYLRGRVTYVRALENGAVSEDQGDFVPEEELALLERRDISNLEQVLQNKSFKSHLILWTSTMSEKQSRAYQRSFETSNDIGNSNLQASNFVFPDDTWGSGLSDQERAQISEERRIRKLAKEKVEEFKKSGKTGGGNSRFIDEEDLEEEPDTFVPKGNSGFRKYVVTRGSSYFPTKEFVKSINTIEKIEELGCKMAEIIKHVKNEKGNCFVYCDYYKGSGAIVLACCLKAMGFDQFDEKQSIFTNINQDNTLKPFCASGTSSAETRKVRDNFPSFQKTGKYRFAFLTSGLDETKQQIMMEAMNSYENRHGDYIKVFITTEVGKVGININNCLQVHLMGPQWNPSSTWQALSRALRATSHEDILNEKRKKYIEKGKNPEDVEIKVRIFKHAAVPDRRYKSFNAPSIDLSIYILSEFKDFKIRNTMRKLQQCSIACYSHYNRNVRKTDKDGSAICGYNKCRYRCVGNFMKEDVSTYDIYYAQELIPEIAKEIRDFFRQTYVSSFESLAIFLSQYDKKYITMALESIIDNKVVFLDRNGYVSYLKEDNGSFYLDHTYPDSSKGSIAMSYYTADIIALQKESLSNIIIMTNNEKDSGTLMDIKENRSREKFDILIDKIGTSSKIILVEDAIEEMVIDKVDIESPKYSYIRFVLDKFKNNIFELKEPVTEINKYNLKLQDIRSAPGRKRDPNATRRLQKINTGKLSEEKLESILEKDTETIYIHTMFSQVSAQTSYATSSHYNKAEGRIRILKPSEWPVGWRDLSSEAEKVVYNILLQITIELRNEKLAGESGYYGTIINGEFRIISPIEGISAEQAKSLDNRRKPKGRLCKNINIDSLYDIMYNIKYPVELDRVYLEEERTEAVRNIKNGGIKTKGVEDWPIEKLSYFLTLIGADVRKKPLSKENICVDIQDFMEKQGMLRI